MDATFEVRYQDTIPLSAVIELVLPADENGNLSNELVGHDAFLECGFLPVFGKQLTFDWGRLTEDGTGRMGNTIVEGTDRAELDVNITALIEESVRRIKYTRTYGNASFLSGESYSSVIDLDEEE